MLHQGFSSRRFGAIETAARTRLRRLHAATNLHDLARIPGNRLEALKGDRAGPSGIRSNGQWRICFPWRDGSVYDVDIVDYHGEEKHACPEKETPPIHPGQVLREDLQDAGISLNQLARDLRVPMNRISAIVNGKRSITADTALRLARCFGTSAQYWMHLQTAYDLEVAGPELAVRVEREVLRRAAA